MTLAELRDKADAKLATFWTLLVSKQNAYYANHGKFFQLLVTPSNTVIDGVDTDFTDNAPSDEPHVIDRDFAFAEKIPFNIRVDEWVAQDRQGFRATVVVELLSGERYTRNRSYETVPDVCVTDGDNTVCTPQAPIQVDSGWSQIIEE